jgi:aminopeptidase N
MKSIVLLTNFLLFFSLAMSLEPVSESIAGVRSGRDATGSNVSASAVARPPQHAAEDFHSYANPGDVRVRHLDLDWDVLFDQKTLKGTAVLSVERVSQNRHAPLILDTRNLNIEKIEISPDGTNYAATAFTVGSLDPILGAPLTIQLPERARRVRIRYSTNPGASGLQWLGPSQTAGKKDPFMFTQSEAIHARSWIPLQDTPQVRVTYTAHVRTPRQLLAVMSAENDRARRVMATTSSGCCNPFLHI